MARARSTRFVDAAGGLLTERVDVQAWNRTGSKAGSAVESGGVVVYALRCSIQPRASLPVKTVMGMLPDSTHMLYCPAEDANLAVYDVHMGDHIKEVTADRAAREFVVTTEPQKFPDFNTGGWHHLEMELREDVYA